jgi:hypothetical protein
MLSDINLDAAIQPGKRINLVLPRPISNIYIDDVATINVHL